MRDILVQNTLTPKLQSIRAKAFFVYDFTKQDEIVGKASDQALPLASLTKLMTVRVALQHNSPLEFYTAEARDLESDGFIGFIPGDSYRISDLIRAALISSLNDAAIMLSRSVGVTDEGFVSKMNAEAKKLQLNTLHFENPTGLDIDDTIATAHGSARDILKLLHADYVDFPESMSTSTRPTDTIKSTAGSAIPLKNTNMIVDSLPVLLASKTGYTDTAGGNLAVLWREPGNSILGAVVLGSTELARFADMKALHDGASKYVSAARSLPSYCSTLK